MVRRKYFMINLHERMLPTSAGVEPATSWSPVGRRIQLSHRCRQLGSVKVYEFYGNSMCKFRITEGKPEFSDQFRKNDML